MKFRRGIYFLGLLALICSMGFAEKPKKTSKKSQRPDGPLILRLMTYNIRIGVGGGNWDGNPAKINLLPIAKIISDHDVDFVGLQEVDCFRKRSGGLNQPKWFSEQLRMNLAFQPAYSVPTNLGLDEEYGVALLSPHWIHSFERFTLFKPDYSKSHPNYPDYYSEQRVLLHALMSIGTQRFHVFVTHLGLTEDQREEQIRQIVDIMSRFAGPKILLGDLNAEPTSAEMAPLFEEYRDVLSETGVKK
jgi:endonuclease/exonuclease/phosphatase family metal-dependent hydrolase